MDFCIFSSVSSAMVATITSLLCAPSCEDTDEVLEDLCKVCQYKFGIHHVTFQVTQDRRLVGNGGRPCGH